MMMDSNHLETSNKWNWSTFCEHGDNIKPWHGSDFGHCFEQLAILSPTHVLLAIVSSYHFGRRWSSLRGNTLYVSWTWFLVARFLSTLVLMLSPVLQVIFSVSLEHSLPSIADGVVAGLAFLSWTLHSLYVWNLRYLHQNTLRGPLSAIVSVLVVTASCAVHVHTVVSRRQAKSSHQLLTEEVTTYINAAFCLVYIVSIIPNKRRVYHSDVHIPINDSEDDTEPLTWDRIRNYNTTQQLVENTQIISESGVGCLSWLSFQWVQALMTRGAEMKINCIEDLYKLPTRLNTNDINKAFESVMLSKLSVPETAQRADRSYHQIRDQHFSHVGFSHENAQYGNTWPYNKQKSKKISLFRILNNYFGAEYYALGILKLLADMFGFAGPVLLNYLVTFIEHRSEPIYHGYLYVGGLFLSTLLATLCSTQFDYNVQIVSYKIRCALVTTIYRKSLSISGVAQVFMFTCI